MATRAQNRGVELHGKTVGIIGYGNMGSSFATRLKGFGVKVLAYDKFKKGFGDNDVSESSLDNIFAEADILSLHIPLTPETKFMVDSLFLNSFKKDIYLINTARGKAVKTDDLVSSLKSGKVKGACLDVLEYESHSFYNFDSASLPDAYQYLISSDKVLLSPHIAGWSVESYEKISRVLVNKIKALSAPL